MPCPRVGNRYHGSGGTTREKRKVDAGATKQNACRCGTSEQKDLDGGHRSRDVVESLPVCWNRVGGVSNLRDRINEREEFRKSVVSGAVIIIVSVAVLENGSPCKIPLASESWILKKIISGAKRASAQIVVSARRRLSIRRLDLTMAVRGYGDHGATVIDERVLRKREGVAPKLTRFAPL
jgi:hypothetical protein